jgi:heme-binding protein
MSHAVAVIRRTAFGVLAAGLTCTALTLPVASADPVAPPVAPTAQPVDDCNAATLAKTISSVTASLSDYLAVHPDANQALIDATRQPAYAAVGQFDSYFTDHPDEANDLRAIQGPLGAFKDRCGLQVSPTDALTVLAEV